MEVGRSLISPFCLLSALKTIWRPSPRALRRLTVQSAEGRESMATALGHALKNEALHLMGLVTGT